MQTGGKLGYSLKMSTEEPWSFTKKSSSQSKKVRFNLLALEHGEYYFQASCLNQRKHSIASNIQADNSSQRVLLHCGDTFGIPCRKRLSTAPYRVVQ